MYVFSFNAVLTTAIYVLQKALYKFYLLI